MNEAKVLDNWEGCYSKSSETDPCLDDQQPFTNAVVSIDYDLYVYQNCAASCIGRGAFGCVFRGMDNRTRKAVAVKKMPKMSMKSNELKVMKAVKSEFLVGLINICVNDQDESLYIIMELCDIDLEKHLKYHTVDGSLSPHNLRRLIDNITRGYNALYECCIVHRDIKPQNILIKYSAYGENLFDVAKISDFGISRILGDEDSEVLSNVAGTFYYMAPEVGANILTTHEYGHEVDMWSLGCVFYQCITGKIPFDERELCRMFLFVACDNFEAYDRPEIPDGMDEDVVRLVNALLEIDSSKRTTPPRLYHEICRWGGSRRFSNACSYVDDSLSCRSSDSTTGYEID